MNFCPLLLLCSSNGDPGSCKSDTGITNIPQASQQKKCSRSKSEGTNESNGRGENLATSK